MNAHLPRRTRLWAALASMCCLAATIAAPARATAEPQPRAAAAPVEALLIGDSVMHGMAQTYGAPARALLGARHSFILQSAGCRRLITTSCRILPAPAPTNAITVLKQFAGTYNRVLVIAAGYNDPTNTSVGVGAAVDTIIAEARRQGIGAVVWLTYREAGSSSNRSRFHAHNVLLRSKLAQYPDLHLADWATLSSGLPSSWFSADGIHLGGQAATAMAKLIADTIDTIPWIPLRCQSWRVIGFPADTTAPLTGTATEGGVHLLTTPARIVDTRTASGKLGANRVWPVVIAGSAGVPADATAVFVTVTAVRPCASTAVRAYPCQGGPPLASILNAPTDAVVAAPALVRLGNGGICLQPSAATDIVVDLTGWVGAAGDGTAPIEPVRLVDTRSGQAELAAVPQSALTAGQHVSVDLTGLTEVPDGTTAVSLNLTALSPAAAGFLTVTPGVCDAATPTTSTLNVAAGQARAAAATVAVVDHAVCLYSSVATDVTLDLQATHGAGGSVVPASPIRWADTRGGAAVSPGSPLHIDVDTLPSGAAPVGRSGAMLSIVAIGTPAGSVVWAAPCSEPAPTFPQVVAPPTQNTANRVIVPLDAGELCISASAATHVVVDLEAWVLAPPSS